MNRTIHNQSRVPTRPTAGRGKSGSALLAAAVLCLSPFDAARAQKSDAGVVFAEMAYRRGAWFNYFGAVGALNGNIDQSGFLVRGMAIGGIEKYRTIGADPADFDRRIAKGEVGVGHQWVLPGATVFAFVGADYMSVSLKPRDDSDTSSGQKVGAFVMGGISTAIHLPYYAEVTAKYSTGNEFYWTKGRLGARFGGLVVGPEVELSGYAEYDEKRAGAFISGLKLGSLYFDLSGGYAWVESRNPNRNYGGDSAYGTIATVYRF